MWSFTRKIKSVGSIMKPLLKTRDNLVAARDVRTSAIDANVQRIKNIEQENINHAQEASLAISMIDGLNAQLKPLDALVKAKDIK